jgi:hypothetical protein
MSCCVLHHCDECGVSGGAGLIFMMTRMCQFTAGQSGMHACAGRGWRWTLRWRTRSGWSSAATRSASTSRRSSGGPLGAAAP